MNDKRRFKRVSKRFIVKYKELAMSDEVKDVFLSQLVNISATGLLFESVKAYPVDTVLKLELKIDQWKKFSSDFIFTTNGGIKIWRIIRRESNQHAEII